MHTHKACAYLELVTFMLSFSAATTCGAFRLGKEEKEEEEEEEEEEEAVAVAEEEEEEEEA